MPPSTAPEASAARPSLPGAATSRAVIDLEAVAHNGRRLAQVAGVPWMAVVKADAYGHGLGPIALTALSVGASWLGVAQLAEALALRALLDEADVDRPAGEPSGQAPRILTWLLPVMDPARAAAEDSPLRAALAADLDLSVSTLPQLEALSAAARAQATTARLHLKVDTGMSRGGAMAEDLPALAAALRQAEDEGVVDVVGLWSHLSRADEPTSGSTEQHLERYRQAEQIVQEAGLRPSIHHLAATGGLLWHPEARMDLVRAGIGLYGLSPDPSVATSSELGLQPAMRLESALVQVKRIDAGQAVSYGGTWRAPTDRWVGLVPLGYSDGIPRAAGSTGPVGVGGIMSSIVGRVCMDQVVIDLGPARDETGALLPAPAQVGDTAVLWGAPDAVGQVAVPTADEWAQACGTINYEIVTRLGARVPRCYVGAEAGGGYARP
ncbi:alanine racemase [Actinomyces naeslundii]|uniref:alanine racemase n=1 Tax=Actinomyces naeslundii TaxID=1655 RepID=UPI00094CA872|nr:alanine racemase [Actinomyces naeslundii]OLO90515.1 alanine racemase [Actinomyces naeslundii]